MSEAQVAQTEENTTDQTAPEAVSLQDLGLLLNIVDLASKRGAFQGAELTQVGAVFDKLNTFLTYVAEQQAAQAEDEEGTSEE